MCERAREPYSIPKLGVALISAVTMIVITGCPDTPPARSDPEDTVRVVYMPETFDVIHQEMVNPAAEGNESGDNFATAVVAGDFNGDAHQDLAISIRGEDGSSGAVVVLFWDPAAPDPEYPFDEGIVLFRDDPGVIGAGPRASADHFGYSLAVGNFGLDLCDDLVIGAPNAEGSLGATNQGVFQVRYGHSSHPLADGVESSWLINDEDHSFDHLGFSLAIGNFNGDFVDDLAIGAYGARNAEGKSEAGKVYVCYGHESYGLQTDLNQQCDLVTPAPIAAHDEHMRFGYALAAGDFNGQQELSSGYNLHVADLAIGAPAVNGQYGRIFVRPGTEEGVFPDADYYYVDSPTPDPAERFGFALAAGDLQNDQVDDLIIGAPHSAGGGFVHIIGPEVDPSDSTPIDFPDTITESFDRTGLWAGSFDTCAACPFGEVLAICDFNGDNLDDIAIGVPNAYNLTSGYVALRAGASRGSYGPTQSEGFSAVIQAPASADDIGDRFGSSIAAIDLYMQDMLGYGFDDLVIGAPFEKYGESSHTGVAILARPLETGAWGPVSGVYQSTSTAYTLRASISQDLDDNEVRVRMWVNEGFFRLEANDCTNVPDIAASYRDNEIFYPPDYDIIPADGSVVSGTPPTFSGDYEVDLRSNILGTVEYTVTADQYNAETGQWDRLHVTIDRIQWQRSSLNGHCTPTPESLTFDRVTPRYW